MAISKKQKKEVIKNNLVIEKKKKFEEWEEKLRNGEAFKSAKTLLMEGTYLPCDPDHYIRRFAKEIYQKYRIDDGDTSKITKEEYALIEEARMAFGIENDNSILSSIEKEYQGMAMSVRRELIKEYSCQTYSEKMLVDMVVSSYMRNITASRKLKNVLSLSETSDILNKFVSNVSQEIDRAQRHFITTLTTLKQMKSPSLSVNVKTNNAFFAQNQQINSIDEANQSPNKVTNENIEQQ